jgi:hypothetical protein
MSKVLRCSDSRLMQPIPTTHCMCTSYISHLCYMYFPSHPHRLDHINTIWWGIQKCKASHYIAFPSFFILRSRYSPQRCVLTLKHRQECKPHLQQIVIAHKLNCDRTMWQYVVQIWHQRPVAVLFHYIMPTVHHIVEILVWICNIKTKGAIQTSRPVSIHNMIKAISVTGHQSLKDCEMLRIPHCLDSWLTDGGKVASLTRRLSFTPQNIIFCFWYSFLLEAEWTPGSSADGRIR